MRTIGVVTVGRSDFGIYLPVLRAIAADPQLKLHLIVSGAHLSPEFGWTVRDITAHGFEIGEQVDMLLSSDTPAAIAKSMGMGMIGFAQAYARTRPDILLVLGDRFEMHAAAAAAVPFKIPLAHLHGGEVTEGAIDDAFRHAITKYSHLHFVSTAGHARRVIQLGEDPRRVIVSGAPSLDNLRSIRYLTQAELEERCGMKFERPPLVVTYHPVTLQHEQTDWQVQQLLDALAVQPHPIIFTKPNADTNGRVIIERIEQFVKKHPRARLVDNLGTEAFFSLMRIAVAMVGNSSSGIIEAASFELPVLNIGLRQAGRERSQNVVDVGNLRDEIDGGLAQVLDPGFRRSLIGMTNVFGSGNAAEIIVEHLKRVRLDDGFVMKRFHDAPKIREDSSSTIQEASAAA